MINSWHKLTDRNNKPVLIASNQVPLLKALKEMSQKVSLELCSYCHSALFEVNEAGIERCYRCKRSRDGELWG